MEVTPHDRIVFTHAWQDAAGNAEHETTVTITLEDLGEGRTRLTFHQAFFLSEASRAGHAEGWTETFDNLERYLAAWKLYLTLGACSLADHIALTEAGIDVETITVDLRTGRTEHGDIFAAINPKGYVPALLFDDGEVLTEKMWRSWTGSPERRRSLRPQVGSDDRATSRCWLSSRPRSTDPSCARCSRRRRPEKQAARQAIAARLGADRQWPQRRLPVR